MLNRSQLTNLALSNAPTEGHSEFDIMSIATCYLAGPMRGIQYFNFPAFEEATQQLRESGWFVFSPRENDAEAGLEPDPNGKTIRPLKWYMRKDLSQVASSDAIFFLPGWEDSQGAMLEHQVAQYLEIPCYLYENGGRISIIGSDQDGMLLGIDHDQIEGRELFDTLLGESPEQPPLYPSMQEQLDREKDKAIRELRAIGREFVPQRNSTGELMARAMRQVEDYYGVVCCGDPDDDCDDRYDPHQSAEKIQHTLELEPIDLDKLVDDAVRSYDLKRGNRHPNSARFHELLSEMGALHDRKQKDYGAGDDPFANVRNSQGFGVDPWVGAMIRLNDKIKRLQSLQSNGRLENESAYDSFKDIAVYSIIALVLFEEQYGRES